MTTTIRGCCFRTEYLPENNSIISLEWTSAIAVGSGWCERGKRFEALKSGRRTRRMNMIAAYCEQRLMAPFTVEGACNRVVFETWLESCLVPTLIPRQVVMRGSRHVYIIGEGLLP